MKKKLAKIATLAIIVTISVLGINIKKDNNSPIELILANTEALAQKEGGSSDSWPCWSSGKRGGTGFWKCGNPCEYIEGESPWRSRKDSDCHKSK